MSDDRCKVDLSRSDKYANEIPDEDLETALKVIRSMRDFCLGPGYFDADGAVILSHAHAKIVEMVEQVLEVERNEPCQL